MNVLDALKTNLLDLHHEVAEHGINLILGGGYGLYLKQQHLQSQSIETVLDVEMWPVPRATNDLDVFLTAEVVTDSNSMEVIRSSLDKLGYSEIESAKFYQFVKPIQHHAAGQAGSVGRTAWTVRRSREEGRPSCSATS